MHATRFVDVVGNREDVGGGDNDVLGEGTGTIDTETDRVCTKTTPTGPAVAAVTARDVPFRGDPLTWLDDVDLRPDRFHDAHEFMTDCHGKGDRGLGPIVPFHDVEIGSADRRLGHPHQSVVGSGRWRLDIFQPDSRLGARFHEGSHGTTPRSRPTVVNASIARSMWAGVWAADIWVRIRA